MKTLNTLASWVRTAELEPNATKRLNEHYLHHWFTHEIAAAEGPISFMGGNIHPEWPTRKLALSREDEITYNASDRSYYSKNPDSRRGAGHIDFAVGDMYTPEVLIEFKWNDAYDEWEFDFLKMMDPRLRARHRICFGVLPRGWAGPRNNWKLDLSPLNKSLRQAMAKSRHELSNSKPGTELVPFTTHFFCLALGREGGTPFELIQKGVAALAHIKLTSEDIQNMTPSDCRFTNIPADNCLSKFKV
jgi:hypothetical protein